MVWKQKGPNVTTIQYFIIEIIVIVGMVDVVSIPLFSAIIFVIHNIIIILILQRIITVFGGRMIIAQLYRLALISPSTSSIRGTQLPPT